MRLATIVSLLLCVVFAGGCSTWRNPNIVDPSKRDEILARDKAHCHKVSESQVPVQPGNEMPGPRGTILDDASTYETRFSERTDQYNSFEHCMRAHGWVKD
jgi:hypothetical protein